MATFTLAEKAILLNPADDVMIAKANIPAQESARATPERLDTLAAEFIWDSLARSSYRLRGVING